jgi:hypothetical protein
MKKFQCTFYLQAELNNEFWELIPSHRSYINNLMREEVIITYSVNHTRSKGWVVLNAETEIEAAELIDQFPIRRFINYEMDELFIFDSMIGAPKLVMN